MNINLTSSDFMVMSPLLILLFGALSVLLLESFYEKGSQKFSAWITLITILVAGAAAVLIVLNGISPLLKPWLRFDGLSKFFTLFFLAIGLGSTLLAKAFFKRFLASHGEYYFLLLCALIGLILIGDAADFLTLFLGLETLSISLYVLCGYMKKWEFSHEAAIKYFFTGAIAAAILLYGIALIYGAIGSLGFADMLAKYRSISGVSSQLLFLCGIGLVSVGLAFKAAVVPFHVWAPDVYDGAPTPVTAFMSVGTKVGAFAAFSIVFLVFLRQFDMIWNYAIALLSYLTIIYANFVALRQTQLRRFFAYSGISHSGFMLIPLAAGTQDSLSALLFYLVIYSFATMGSFAVLAFLDKRPEGVMLRDLYGLFYRSPFAAAILSICFLTLAGIPPTAGFLAKFYVFKVAFQAGYYGLVIVGLLTTILSAYYYLRFVAVMFTEEPESAEPSPSPWPIIALGGLSLAGILVLSIFPGPFLALLL